MKKNVAEYFCICIFFMTMISESTSGVVKDTCNQDEFIVKKKNKKESPSIVKDDIGELLELSLRQTSKNITELANMQQKIFDKIKDVVGACEKENSVFAGTAEQLKTQRNKLKVFYDKLLQQEDDLQSFLNCF